MKSNKILMFATANDTGLWAVALDGYYQTFATEQTARAAYISAVGDDSVAIEETGFGSAQLLSPRWSSAATCLGHASLSTYQPIDLLNYIAVTKSGQRRRHAAGIAAGATPAQRLAAKREWAAFFGDSASIA